MSDERIGAMCAGGCGRVLAGSPLDVDGRCIFCQPKPNTTILPLKEQRENFHAKIVAFIQGAVSAASIPTTQESERPRAQNPEAATGIEPRPSPAPEYSVEGLARTDDSTTPDATVQALTPLTAKAIDAAAAESYKDAVTPIGDMTGDYHLGFCNGVALSENRRPTLQTPGAPIAISEEQLCRTIMFLRESVAGGWRINSPTIAENIADELAALIPRPCGRCCWPADCESEKLCLKAGQ